MIQIDGHREAPKQCNTGGHQIWAGEARIFSAPQFTRPSDTVRYDRTQRATQKGCIHDRIQTVGHREAPTQGNTGGHQIWAGEACLFSRPNLYGITTVNAITCNYITRNYT